MFFVDVFVVSVTTNGCNMFTNLFRETIGAEITFNPVENGVFQNMRTLCENLRGPSLMSKLIASELNVIPLCIHF